MTSEEKEKAQELIKELMVLREDISGLEKRLQLIQNKTVELYEKLDDILDENGEIGTRKNE